MRFFGVLSVLLTVVAGILFVPVLLQYFETGLVPRFPTLIVCGFMVMAAIQSFFAGMILDVLMAKDRKDFECRLIKVSGEKER